MNVNFSFFVIRDKLTKLIYKMLSFKISFACVEATTKQEPRSINRKNTRKKEKEMGGN
jgi:hypothetical protein